jgi:two-component system NtrC family sensor kinase
VDIPKDLPPVSCRQGDLEQLFLNLITNARDAMHDGGRLSVHARTDGDWIEIIIADTGCGIPPVDLTRVQEPFFTTKPDGTGLGLTICRSIVWEMGGELNIASRPGEGTRVTVRVPISPPQSQEDLA